MITDDNWNRNHKTKVLSDYGIPLTLAYNYYFEAFGVVFFDSLYSVECTVYIHPLNKRNQSFLI